MTDFKGTTEKWESIFISENKRAVRSKGGLICVLPKPSRYSGQDERYERELIVNKADQLLIQKAPELLEALKEANNVLKMASLIDKSNVCEDTQLMCEKLIKETTNI